MLSDHSRLLHPRYSDMIRATIVILLHCLSGYAFCQEVQIPAKADLMVFSRPMSSSMYAVAEIMPIGWSEDGKFAYAHRRSVAGRGGVLFSYIIVSSVTDEIVWKYEDDWPDSNTVTAAESVQRSREPIEVHLGKHNIVQGQGTTLNGFPLTREGASFEPELKVLRKAEKHPFLGDIASLGVHMVRDGAETKRILHRDDPGAFSYWIAGYFLSPFEPRILVVIGEEKWGFEGTEGDFIFSGCSLTRGFR